MKKRKIFLSIIVFILGFFVFVGDLNAKQVIKLKEAEYSENFKKYLKLSSIEREKYLMPFITKTKFINSTELVGDANLPVYDLRTKGMVTPIKDQNPSGSCWAFATMASIESNLLMNGKGKYDLSEAHLELSTQSTFPLKYPTFNRKFNGGGTNLHASSYLQNGMGPVLESEFPFKIETDLINSKATTFDTSVLYSKKPKFEVNNIYGLLNNDGAVCSKDGLMTKQIKNNIVKYGAVAATINWDNIDLELKECVQQSNGRQLCSVKGKYINDAYYNYNGYGFLNHAITIVGWDDTVPVEKFSPEARPSKPGAWIIKNSWGTVTNTEEFDIKQGDNGYFYVSYEDTNICKQAFNYANVSEKKSDNIYYYDDLGWGGLALTKKNKPSMYTAFKFAKKSSSNKLEKINKLVFPNAIIGGDYEIYYAKAGELNINNAELIAKGKTDSLFQTVTLNKDIYTDSDFVIYLKLFQFDNSVIIPVSTKGKNGYDNVVVTPNVTFISENGTNWLDTSKSSPKGFNTILKVYTSNVDKSSVTTTKATTKKSTTATKPVTTTKKEEGEIIVEPNENNDESIIEQEQPKEKNPSTIDTNISLVFAGLILLFMIMMIAVKKISKNKDNI